MRSPGANWGPALQADQAGAALRFLQLIRFRYISNHVHPSELLRSENAALQQSLITELRLRRARQPQAGPAWAAKRAIRKAHCSVGKVRKAFSTRTRRGRMISQKPRPGKKLPAGSKVKLKLSKGKKP